MDIAGKPYKATGITKPRLVAKSLQIAKLLELQRAQLNDNKPISEDIPYFHEANLMGVISYFMMMRIENCQRTQQCDPSKGALFHWFDDTFRRIYELPKDDPQKTEELRQERGDVVGFFLQNIFPFVEVTKVLQSLNPYDLVIYGIPDQRRLLNEHVQLTSIDAYRSLLQHLLQQYSVDGLELIDQYKKMDQIFEGRTLMRSMTTMRSLARGVGKAALSNKDYITAIHSFFFSGDLAHEDIRNIFTSAVIEMENEHPQLCEEILKFLDTPYTDWFIQLKNAYQPAPYEPKANN
ncbi:MAG: hypothetical protein A2V81_02310 [Candidatus Abawacabacteria bacterium RBG_16_42_10]|uniref:Uncharacterized protein n=1 Tax=Candidatus Abawacabacteria bacterium RBG_16_42_10 TaxID=1817814 RepID=A0A1F4XKV7_9BACT|nr:MAG: hypothetical protein A2V81_02310 [Candidatus Abawacabacteria bacterium RBG_16_42_10]